MFKQLVPKFLRRKRGTPPEADADDNPEPTPLPLPEKTPYEAYFDVYQAHFWYDYKSGDPFKGSSRDPVNGKSVVDLTGRCDDADIVNDGYKTSGDLPTCVFQTELRLKLWTAYRQEHPFPINPGVDCKRAATTALSETARSLAREKRENDAEITRLDALIQECRNQYTITKWIPGSGACSDATEEGYVAQKTELDKRQAELQTTLDRQLDADAGDLCELLAEQRVYMAKYFPEGWSPEKALRHLCDTYGVQPSPLFSKSKKKARALAKVKWCVELFDIYRGHYVPFCKAQREEMEAHRKSLADAHTFLTWSSTH